MISKETFMAIYKESMLRCRRTCRQNQIELYLKQYKRNNHCSWDALKSAVKSLDDLCIECNCTPDTDYMYDALTEYIAQENLITSNVISGLFNGMQTQAEGLQIIAKAAANQIKTREIG